MQYGNHKDDVVVDGYDDDGDDDDDDDDDDVDNDEEGSQRLEITDQQRKFAFIRSRKNVNKKMNILLESCQKTVRHLSIIQQIQSYFLLIFRRYLQYLATE